MGQHFAEILWMLHGHQRVLLPVYDQHGAGDRRQNVTTFVAVVLLEQSTVAPGYAQRSLNPRSHVHRPNGLQVAIVVHLQVGVASLLRQAGHVGDGWGIIDTLSDHSPR